tara:strand:+ start:1656 stop:2189 length:534 start_codon:yes stop_codon:yes gene_type:complete
MAEIINKINYFIVIILLTSCVQNYNNEKINSLLELEQITKTDVQNLELLKKEDVQNILKIAKFNLSQIEEKKLDSMEIELIYFEYRDYLHCINNLHEVMNTIKTLQNTLSVNETQLKNIKYDYANSKERRSDLDKHLLQEKKIVLETSARVFEAINTIKKEKKKFSSLNKKIEEIIE